jgi:hypothetical protein
MTHTLILEVPDEVFVPLAKTAQETGATLEKLAVEWLAAASRKGEDDPLEEWIGAFASTVPDWADQHDKYIGQALMDELRGDQLKDDESKDDEAK